MRIFFIKINQILLMEVDTPVLSRVKSLVESVPKKGLEPYYSQKIEEMEIRIIEKK